jgi:hypothetical protein
MTYQVGDQQKSVTINKKKLFIIKDYNQSILKKYKINQPILIYKFSCYEKDTSNFNSTYIIKQHFLF